MAYAISLRYNELMNPQNKVDITWSPDFAYALGLLTTDGSLSKDGRHISFTSKDKEQIKNFKFSLKLNNKIGRKSRGGETEKKYYVLQFGDITFYKFLLSIGLMPNKSKILSDLQIPNKYFFDFLRGHFDGDGYCYSYWDKRWKSSFMFYLGFISASIEHILWLRNRIKKNLQIEGHITNGKRVIQLKYAKKQARMIISKLYYQKNLLFLSRKHKKLEKIIKIDNKESNIKRAGAVIW